MIPCDVVAKKLGRVGGAQHAIAVLGARTVRAHERDLGFAALTKHGSPPQLGVLGSQARDLAPGPVRLELQALVVLRGDAVLLARVRVGLRALEAVQPLLELPRQLRLALQLRPAVGEALLARRQLLVHAVDGLPALLERARSLHEGVGGQHVAVWQHLLR